MLNRWLKAPIFILLALNSLQSFAETPRPRTQAVAETVISKKQRSSETNAQIVLQYAQSGDAFAVVGNVRRAQGNLPAINSILRSKYGVPEEVFTKIGLRLTQGLGDLLPGYIFFDSRAEGLGYGVVQNPVVPELHADGVVVGLFGGGYGFAVSDLGLKLKFGFLAGFGREKRIDAASTDLIESIPLRVGAVNVYGFDFDLGHRYQLDRDFALNSEIGTHETIFETTTPLGSLSEAQSQSLLTHRWKAKTELERKIQMPIFQKATLGVEAIAGPQPLPVEILPRVWDYAHNLYPTPELGAMFGAGAHFKGRLSLHTSLQAHGGFYGGYPGGDISLTWRGVTATVASWGIEDSAAYRALGERIWQGSLSFSL